MDFKEIKQLFEVTDNRFGFTESAILACEDRISIKFPQILRDYYLQLGENDAINQTLNSLIDLAELQFENGYLIFYSENQGVSNWGISKDDFSLNDPPVYISFDGKTWELDANTLSSFLKSMAYYQALFSFPYNANVTEAEQKYCRIIEKNWQKVDLISSFWQIDFYQNNYDEVIAILKTDNNVDIFVAAKSLETFKKIEKKLQIEWDYSSLDD
jgi:hypothetical protein